MHCVQQLVGLSVLSLEYSAFFLTPSSSRASTEITALLKTHGITNAVLKIYVVGD